MSKYLITIDGVKNFFKGAMIAMIFTMYHENMTSQKNNKLKYDHDIKELEERLEKRYRK